jgi:hypothetical protein
VRLPKAVLAIALLVPCWLDTVRAQIRTDSGAIKGVVLGGSGARVRSARVTLTQLDKGLALSARTDQNGEFRFDAIPPGNYCVRVEKEGFEPKEASPVHVSIGETILLPLNLALVQALFRATVETTAPILDFERTEQSTILDSAHIENLPINRRNYLDLALLTPSVVESTNTANAVDYRVPVLQNSGLSFAGSNGRGNTFEIDGVENIGTTGAMRPSVSQEAVQEFIVNRNSYSAELGGGYGGAVNIITKSGGNRLHGTIFSFLRQSSLEARNYFDFGPSKADFTRSQAGASAGGPIRKDRLFYFAAFERLDRHESTFVPILENRGLLSALTPSQQALTTYLAGIAEMRALSEILQTILRPNSNAMVRSLFDNNSGVFPFSGAATQASVRLDGHLSDRHNMFVRANATSQNEQNARFGALLGYSRGVTNFDRNGTFVIGNHLRINQHWLSASRLSVAYTRYTGLPNDRYSPEINVDGASSFGRDSQYPYARREIHLQFQQTVSYSTARHTVRFGADINPIRAAFEVVPWNGGRFEFASVLPLAVVLNAVTRNPNLATSLGASFVAAGRLDLAQSLGDPISSLQAFSLGLPVTYFQGFGPGHFETWQQRASLFIDDSWRVGRGLFLNAGLRFQGEMDENVRYLRNFAPRFGFSWSFPGRMNWLVRGGAGLFQVFNDLLIPYATYGFKPENNRIVLAPLSGIPGVINPQTGAPVTSVDIWQGLLARGIIGKRQIQYSDLSPYGFIPSFATPVTGDLSAVFRSPYTTQASMEIEHSAGAYTMSIGYQYSRGVHLPRVRDYNLKIIGTRPDGWPLFGSVNPAVLSDYVIESTGNSYYNAMFLQASRRLRKSWTFQASYTLSRAIDDVTDYGFDFAAQNQFDNSAEKGLSLFHQKHRVLASLIYQVPHRGANGLAGRLWSDWTTSGIFQANSFRPFNVLTGYDNVGDNLTTTHRPLGLGRNAGIGPGFVGLEMRLARRIPLRGDQVSLEFAAEMFNIANHTNFISVNNVVGTTPLSSLPHPIAGTRGIPTAPLSFTSAADPRQVQLWLKIHF